MPVALEMVASSLECYYSHKRLQHPREEIHDLP
uniref:Phenylalanyl-tRNA synthetase beta chain n=1 Tax=Rhizophora mucronata TaxID=61149 RepID=A0A2P2IVM4_RHIMU